MQRNRLALSLALLVAGFLAAFVIYPSFNRPKLVPMGGSLPDTAMPERQNKFINMRLLKIERQGDKALLTPLHVLGFDTGKKSGIKPGTAMGDDKPMQVSVGSTFRFLMASPKLTYVVQSIEEDGVTIGFGDSVDKVAGSTKLAWK